MEKWSHPQQITKLILMVYTSCTDNPLHDLQQYLYLVQRNTVTKTVLPIHLGGCYELFFFPLL